MGSVVGRMILFTLIVLTQLDGSMIWVESTAVVIIRTHSKECGPGAHSVIKIGSTAICVTETADEIRAKIREAER